MAPSTSLGNKNSKNSFSLSALAFIMVAIIVGAFHVGLISAAMSINITIRSSGFIATVGPLHVEGKDIKDSSGNTIVLKGVNYARFIDGPTGDWVLPSGGVQWATWDPTLVGQNFDAMKAWGINSVRTLATCEWWIEDTDNFRNRIIEYVELANERDMYIVLTFWRSSGSQSQPSFPYIPTNGVVDEPSTFVNMWSSVADTLKYHSNVIFELWNEPGVNGWTQDQEDVWFETQQQCIDAIRATGATNPIVVDWSGVAVDLANYHQGGTFQTMDWVYDYPLNDTLNNLIYTAHIYRAAFYNATDNFQAVYTYEDMLNCMNLTKVLEVAAQHPVWMGEVGCRLWANPLSEELEWFDATLSIYDEYGIGYAGWWWWGSGTNLQLLTGQADFAPSQGGTILRDHITSTGTIF